MHDNRGLVFVIIWLTGWITGLACLIWHEYKDGKTITLGDLISGFGMCSFGWILPVMITIVESKIWKIEIFGEKSTRKFSDLDYEQAFEEYWEERLKE